MARTLNADVILSKKEKFNRLYDNMSDYLQVSGILRKGYLIELTEANKEFIHSMLEIRVKQFDNEPEFVGEYQIMENIQKMKEFFIEKMSVIPRPIVFGNGYTDDDLDFSYLENPETDGSDKGSKFTCKPERYEEDDNGPFGGAFASDRDYHNWRFGRGFVQD